jgi:hypothetical protein
MTWKEFLKEFPKQMLMQHMANRGLRQMTQVSEDVRFLASQEAARANVENIFERGKTK